MKKSTTNKLHPRNKHQGRYNFEKLTQSNKNLEPFVIENPYNKAKEVKSYTIDFFNSEAVKELNKALLIHYYGIKYWEIPDEFLTPSIPSRAEYIHLVADLLVVNKNQKLNLQKINCLDIGVGANLVYPIIGVSEYNWNFVGSDINKKAIEIGQKIINTNESLKEKIELRHQSNSSQIFETIIHENELFELIICNPPFHDSEESMLAANNRKTSNLRKKRTKETIQNFNGTNQELWCDGGELAFIKKMINESVRFKFSGLWFTTLVSQEKNLEQLEGYLKKQPIEEIKIIPLIIGNKKSRILCWSYIKVDNHLIGHSK